jgi:hypothetical protein
MTDALLDGLNIITLNTTKDTGGRVPKDAVKTLTKRLATGAFVRAIPPTHTLDDVQEALDTLLAAKVAHNVGTSAGAGSGAGAATGVELTSIRQKHLMSVYLTTPKTISVEPQFDADDGAE